MINSVLDLDYGVNGFTLNLVSSLNKLSKYSVSYSCARPFPHTVIDNFLPSKIAEELLRNFPEKPLPNDKNYLDGGIFEHKKRQILPYDCNGYVKEFFAFFNSGEFLKILEYITGIEGLISDPYYDGGGFHETTNGGKLGVHTDFRLQRKLHLKRRINLLIYLNKDWKDEYNGALELWDQGMNVREALIYPIFNRCVVFSTGADSFHGHPDPLSIPGDMSRKSAALYYYTASGNVYDEVKNVSTIFKARPTDSQHLKDAAKRQNERELNGD